MKKLLIVCVAISISIATTAQKNKVTSAYNYLKYNQLDKAKEAIDEATLHETTMENWKTWFFKGNIYSQLAVSTDEAFAALKKDAIKEAFNAYLKTYEYDDDKKFDVNMVNAQFKNLYGIAFNSGIEAFNVKDYPKAANMFVVSAGVLEHFGSLDTLSLYNAALAADISGNVELAAVNYEKCTKADYKGAQTFNDWANLYRNVGDEKKMMDVVKKGRKKYPNDQNLLTLELNYYIKNEKFDEALENLNIGIANEPENSSFYFARGFIYDNQGNLENAESDYKNSIKYNSEYFDANYNLGALYYNKGAVVQNKCNEILDNDEYVKCKEEADKVFAKALPYLEKAHELNDEDVNTMSSLKQLYVRMKMNDKYEEINAKLSGGQ